MTVGENTKNINNSERPHRILSPHCSRNTEGYGYFGHSAFYTYICSYLHPYKKENKQRNKKKTRDKNEKIIQEDTLNDVFKTQISIKRLNRVLYDKRKKDAAPT